MTTPTKLYKRALFGGVRYPVGKLYEDIPVAYEVTKCAHKAAHIANRDYYYFQRGSSIQNMAFNPRKLDSVRHCHALMENVKRDFPQLSRAAAGTFCWTRRPAKRPGWRRHFPTAAMP